MVIQNNNKAMKSRTKYIGAAVAVLAIAACERFNPEDHIVKEIDLAKCMKPVSVTTQVKYNTVTFDLEVFPDAERYILEIYNSAIDENSEPDVANRLDSLSINPKDIPCKITTVEDQTLYYRIAASNESKGKDQSLWTVGRFTTNVDPATICLTLEPELKECFELIEFNWAKAETDRYLLEIYTKGIPSSGNPDPEDLYKSIELTNEQVPYSEKFPVTDGKYYYRAKAIDLAGKRKDSKWAKGSFETEDFVWPDDDRAVDHGLTGPYVDSYSEPARTPMREMFNGGNPVDASAGTLYNSTEVVWNKIHYMPECGNMKDRISTRGNGKFTEEDEYGVILPKEKRFIYFYINRPGQFNAILRKADGGKGTVALLTNKKGFGAKAVYLFDSDEISTGKGDPTIVDVTEDMLYGITEPAQVFIFSSVKTKGVYLYPITWTPWTPPTE